MAKKNDKKTKKKPSVSGKAKPVKKAAKSVKKAAKPVKKVAKPVKKAAKPVKKAAAPKKAAPQKAGPQKVKEAPQPKKPAEKVAKKGQVVPAKKSKREDKEQEAQLSLEIEQEVEEQQEVQEVVLTDAEGRRYCRVKDCDQLAVVDSYCRYHYLLFWKKIQVRKKILSEGKLERYIEELTARYPDKFLDMLRKDLRSEKEFLAAIQELEIDESAVDNEFEDEAQTYIDEVRGMGEGGSTREEEDF